MKEVNILSISLTGLFVLYLLVAAISSTLQVTIHLSYGNLSWGVLYQRHNDLYGKRRNLRMILGADYTTDVVWYQKVQWLLATVGIEFAILASILYWPLEDHEDEDELSVRSINIHCVNGITAIFDIIFSGTAIRLLHVVYSILIGTAYVVFTIVYHVVGGTDKDGNSHIYSILDYNKHPGRAIDAIIIVVFVVLPLLHLAIYIIYSVRHWLVNKLYRKRLQHESIVEAYEEIVD